MPIGRFSRSCRLSIKTLRHYDQLGLLRPAAIDPATGYRYYASSQARTAVTIATLRGLDVPLAEIRRVLSGHDAEIAAVLGEARERLQRDLTRKQVALRTLDRIVREGAVFPYDVRTRTEPDRTMMRLSIVTSIERHVPDSMDLALRLFAGLREASLPIVDPIIGRLAFDGDGEEMRVDMLAPVPEGTEPCSGAAVERLTGGPVACTLHRGAYEELGLAHHALFAWAQERGHEIRGDVLEIYVNDPMVVAADDLVTEVVMPIA
jgi:DNA-binding transcriptional MerR regulator